MLTVMIMACVVYTDGLQHCDVRVQPMNKLNGLSLPVEVREKACSQEAQAAALKVANTAFDEEGVSYISHAHGVCQGTEEVNYALRVLQDYMFNYRIADYTLTVYQNGKIVHQEYNERSKANAK